MSITNSSTRLSCTGLLRESLTTNKVFPTLTNLCIKKLIPIRNSIKGLKERGISTKLIKLIFKGSTYNELISAEKNNIGIENVFGSYMGREVWDSLWESAMKVKYSDRRHILESKLKDESFRDFYFRKKTDFEIKHRNSVIKCSNNNKLSEYYNSTNNNDIYKRRTTSLLCISSISPQSTSISNSFFYSGTRPIYSSDKINSSDSFNSSTLKPKNVKIASYIYPKERKSNNSILREYFAQKNVIKMNSFKTQSIKPNILSNEFKLNK
ncbi:hypothetical protein FG386_003691 [Cryptosporidium ryanae]|uniref:uncharacterized protein n=1 Tax=Cryptosporidium ryanae TaxID=515981 RepID=UPI003519DF4F|nr:hypothetical protein FG386_003691 [Cryptosporidium ryanae]